MEEDKEQHQPPTSTRWQKFLAFAKEEALWVAETAGMVTLTLAVGRLLSRLGLDVDKLTGGSWVDLVKKALQGENKHEK